jgi:hypothetical protein
MASLRENRARAPYLLALGVMTLRIATWFAFLVTSVFTYFTTALPLSSYVLDSQAVHRSDYMVGWFWMTLFGFLPAICLMGLAYCQRATAPLRIRLLWAMAAAPVLLSAAVFLYQSIQAGDP